MRLHFKRNRQKEKSNNLFVKFGILLTKHLFEDNESIDKTGAASVEFVKSSCE